MLIAEKPTAATRLATEQTDAVMKMALIARRLTTSLSHSRRGAKLRRSLGAANLP